LTVAVILKAACWNAINMKQVSGIAFTVFPFGVATANLSIGDYVRWKNYPGATCRRPELVKDLI
jgi:hypothetical protein